MWGLSEPLLEPPPPPLRALVTGAENEPRRGSLGRGGGFLGTPTHVAQNHPHDPGGATTNGPDATTPPAICQNSGGGGGVGGGVQPGVGGGFLLGVGGGGVPTGGRGGAHDALVLSHISWEESVLIGRFVGDRGEIQCVDEMECQQLRLPRPHEGRQKRAQLLPLSRAQFVCACARACVRISPQCHEAVGMGNRHGSRTDV